MSLSMKKSNRGFTLIELIIVIVILGILAVTASPRFLDLTGDARASTVEGLEGSIKGAASITYSKAIIQGVTGPTGSVDVLNNDSTSDADRFDDNIAVVNGYPRASAVNGVIDQDDFTAVYNNATVANATEVRFYPSGVTAGTAATFANGADCYVTYTNAASANAGPTVTSVISDCN